ncbi:ATP-dependent DNA ligase [Candidatus Bathyarchaeota archaeon]|nr:ATP-dependent DNA ligase [Candidatus Bathyarchaeota archaeon]MBT7186455.1 ATP-dependent DNA ligase [Candidatus Bathyarchaeota archaeon]
MIFFKELASLCKSLEATTKRKEKTALISMFLHTLGESEIKPAILLIIGSVLPETDNRTLDVGWRTISRIIDRKGQTTLFRRDLTVNDVYDTLIEVADSEGPGSRKNKVRLIERLFSDAGPVESEILVRIIFREMRIGVNEGMMMEALAEAVSVPGALVRRALMMTGDIGKVAEEAVLRGEDGLMSLEATLFVPLKPMQANTAETADAVIREYGGKTAFEYKYDGARIQVHGKSGDVRVFSRRLSEVTESLPDVISTISLFDIKRDFILEGEVVAIGKRGKPLPFQDLMRRFGRVNDVEEMVKRIPLRLHLFDVLYLSDRLLIDEPYEERWSELERLVPHEYLVKRIVTDNPSEAEEFKEQALKEGHEGLMAKRLDSRYIPGKRGKLWYKLKTTESLDVVVVAADWGSGRRRGWLSNYHLGVHDGNEYLVIGKTFKGLTDDEFEWITKHLQSLKERETGHTVHVRPELVVEVAFNEIQKSPHYKSGYALRFARITRIRTDKAAGEADTHQRVHALYEKQFEHKDRL